LVIKKSYYLYQKINKFKTPWVPMNTHGYLNTHWYPHSGYPRGYGAVTSIIFIKQDGNGYYTIRTYGYPLTSLSRCILCSKSIIQSNVYNSIIDTHRLFPSFQRGLPFGRLSSI